MARGRSELEGHNHEVNLDDPRQAEDVDGTKWVTLRKKCPRCAEIMQDRVRTHGKTKKGKRPAHPASAIEKHFSVLETAHWTVIFSEKDHAYYLTCQVAPPGTTCLKIPMPSSPRLDEQIKDFIKHSHHSRHPAAYPPG